MKILSALFLSLTLMLISCKSYSINEEYKLDAKNIINSKIVIFVSPTSEEIEKLKAKDEDAFYTSADDVNFYNAKAEEYLEKNNIPYKLTKEKKMKFLVGNKVTEFDYSMSEQAWFIIMYNGKDKPVKESSINIEKYKNLLK